MPEQISGNQGALPFNNNEGLNRTQHNGLSSSQEREIVRRLDDEMSRITLPVPFACQDAMSSVSSTSSDDEDFPSPPPRIFLTRQNAMNPVPFASSDDDQESPNPLLALNSQDRADFNLLPRRLFDNNFTDTPESTHNHPNSYEDWRSVDLNIAFKLFAQNDNLTNIKDSDYLDVLNSRKSVNGDDVYLNLNFFNELEDQFAYLFKILEFAITEGVLSDVTMLVLDFNSKYENNDQAKKYFKNILELNANELYVHIKNLAILFSDDL